MEIKMDYVQQGWQCPICKRVYSPTTSMCMYCGNETTVKITTGTNIDPSAVKALKPYMPQYKEMH